MTFAALLSLLLAANAAPLPSAAWEPLGTRDGISVFRREVPGSPIIAFRGDCRIDASMGKVVSVLSDTRRAKEWMDKLLEARTVRTVSESERVEYNRTAAPWPLADRDFLFGARASVDPANKRIVVTMSSVDDPTAPPLRGVVRGELKRSVWTLTAVDPEHTDVTIEIEADPRGAIPKWIVNLVQRSWPQRTLDGIRRQVKKPDVEEYSAFRSGN
jgi:hypothetical protein